MHLLKCVFSPLDHLRHGTQRRLRLKKRKGLERQWRQVRSTISRKLYVNQCNLVNNLIYESKMTFCSSVIEENKSNQAILFTAFDKMLNRLAPKKLPQDDNAADLANKFAEFFVHKGETIRNSLNSPGFYPNDEKLSAQLQMSYILLLLRQ